MGKGIFIALLNPAISVILAAGFFVLWRHQRERRYIAILAVSYLAVAIGFLLQNVTMPGLVALSKLASNAFFLAGAGAMAAGVLGRFGRRPPYLAMILISVCCLCVLAWFLFVEQDTGWRVYAVNLALAAIVLMIAVKMWGIPDKPMVDHLLMSTLLADTVNFLVRPTAVVLLVGAPSEGDIFMSLYWISTSVSHAFFSVLIAMCLMTGIALDVIGKLQRDALVDPLSGVLNRRGFEERANDALGRVTPSALVLADLDHFKDINDNYGHTVGDRVIAVFGAMLRDLAGEGAVVGRIGGEEFAIVLPGRGSAEAQAIAESVRVSVRNAVIGGLPMASSFSASFGVAESEKSEDMLSQLLRRADVALYQAKDNGRDQVCVFSDSLASIAPRRAFG